MNTISELNNLAKEIHKNAVAHGWWDEERSFGEIIALCHSELSEALEEYRDGKPGLYYNCDVKPIVCLPDQSCSFENTEFCDHKTLKPEGIAVELADCMIRILDYCGHAGIDIDSAIRIKHEYNKARPSRHGGKLL